uniref:Uncharacterized protein n=1 Tax=Peronospora matthiolae TaxID=2874970 RepID=A0AAV1T7J1_9STRA
MRARFQPCASIVYVGSGFHPCGVRGNRALRFFETFQTSFGRTSPCIRLVQILFDDLSVLAVSENKTNDDCVVVKRHYDHETKSDFENVVVTFTITTR